MKRNKKRNERETRETKGSTFASGILDHTRTNFEKSEGGRKCETTDDVIFLARIFILVAPIVHMDRIQVPNGEGGEGGRKGRGEGGAEVVAEFEGGDCGREVGERLVECTL